VKPTERKPGKKVPTLEGSNIRPLQGRRDFFIAVSIRRFHLRLMIFLPFGAGGAIEMNLDKEKAT
jgi:hypothetical protein